MPYATPQDLVDAYGADRILMLAMQADGARDEAKIARALDGASAVIDGYLSSRYALPLTRPAGSGPAEGYPPLLKDATVAIAAYRLASDPAALSEDMRTRFEDAVALLKDIAKGVAGIGVATIAQQQQQSAASAAAAQLASPNVVVEQSVPRAFSRDRLRSM